MNFVFAVCSPNPEKGENWRNLWNISPSLMIWRNVCWLDTFRGSAIDCYRDVYSVSVSICLALDVPDRRWANKGTIYRHERETSLSATTENYFLLHTMSSFGTRTLLSNTRNCFKLRMNKESTRQALSFAYNHRHTPTYAMLSSVWFVCPLSTAAPNESQAAKNFILGPGKLFSSPLKSKNRSDWTRRKKSWNVIVRLERREPSRLYLWTSTLEL